MTSGLEAISGLICVLCGRGSSPAEAPYACPECGPLGTRRVAYDYARIARDFDPRRLPQTPDSLNLCRYLPLLPLSSDTPPLPVQVGWTPLAPAPRLRERLGLPHLFVKDDTRNPTASLKDRASAIAVARAQAEGNEIVACASTGNAAASLAGLAAAAGLGSRIFVPESAPKAKIAQLLAFGATVYPVQGSYDDAFDLCIAACERFGWYCRNTGYNPYLVEGKKTAALEIAEQLDWQCPDTVIVPVGDGCVISGVWKGFWDLHQLGVLDRLPRLIAVQAAGSAAIARALENGGVIEPVQSQTVADSIAVDLPRNGAMAVQDIQASQGFAVVVGDDEIMDGVLLLAREGGIFVEPAAGAAVAGLARLAREGRLDGSERIVLLATGSGLKDVDAVLRRSAIPPSIPADVKRLAPAG